MKMKVGDIVKYNNYYPRVLKRGKTFKIEKIRNCNVNCCFGRENLCPGYVNNSCFGYTEGYSLDMVGKGNPNNGIVIKKTY